jgi:sporulation protein YlmC with PRC-barrel domain
MDLVRDLLDKAVVDSDGREMGRVDRLVIAVEAGAAPRVVAIEIGPAILGARVAAWAGRLIAGLEHAFGVDRGRPVQIPFERVLETSDRIKLDLKFEDTAVATVEQKLRRWVRAIPFAYDPRR